ncbi:hypothetical protein TNCV_3507121 [Trichonephila clavipes]|uniref:Uncharacterized protein n=1 Tax=Trichonephila clavipes TaxID=2585209 RepID=A0A8X6S4P5_TRICX|nr:hypothetical protein TNCV_3507121 [Trichonephila clavipes]
MRCEILHCKISQQNTSVSNASVFMSSQKKKSQLLRYGEPGGKTIDPPCPTPLPGHLAWNWLRPEISENGLVHYRA